MSADVCALSSLLLVVEWGHEFSEAAYHRTESNRVLAATRTNISSSGDQLVWRLCQLLSLSTPLAEADPIDELIANLDHHNSGIRSWMTRIGWIVRPWLPADKAIPFLLKNLADTIFGPFDSAGLAAALVASEDEFLDLARRFAPPSFDEQYRDRLAHAEELGINAIQAPLWRLEAQCRKEIERTVLGQRLTLLPLGVAV
jgi:hypothetical protein